MEETAEQKRNASIEIIEEMIEAHGLAYAIETGTLTPGSLEDEELSALVKQASDAMRKLKMVAGY